MKSKKLTSKLQLKKETITLLNDDEANEIVGGEASGSCIFCESNWGLCETDGPLCTVGPPHPNCNDECLMGLPCPLDYAGGRC